MILGQMVIFKSVNGHFDPVSLGEMIILGSRYKLRLLLAADLLSDTGAKDQRLFKRLKDHKKDHLSERWNRFSWFGTLGVLTNKARTLSANTNNLNASITIGLNNLEAIVTAVAEPRLNLQRGNWGQANKYFQYLDEQLNQADDREEEKD